MVTGLSAHGLRVVIFTNDHQPAHVHVLGDGEAEINLRGADGIPELIWADAMSRGAVNAGSGMIVAQTLTDQDADEPSQVEPLLNQVKCPIARVTADGAYDGSPTYETIAAHDGDTEVVIPPRSTAVLSGEQGPLEQRDRHLEMITEKGRLAWQKATDYGKRSLVETTMGRYKTLIASRLRARGFAAQQTEAAIGVTVLTRMLAGGRPDTVRSRRVIA
jgi:hypothetical protein